MGNNRHNELALLKTKSRVFDNRTSYLKKYQDIAVGNPRFISLLKYELIVTIFGWIPGALGLFLRKESYARLFKPKLTRVIFGKNVDVFNPTKIQIGRNSLIGDNCLLEVKRSGSISIGEKVTIGRGTLIRCGLGSIEIGDNTTIAAYSHVSAMGTRVKLGKDVLMGGYGYIIGSAYGYGNLNLPIRSQVQAGKGIVIEDNVWLGAGVYVIDGNKIGTGSIIGAGSVVSKSIPKYSVAVGVPATVIKNRTPSSSRLHQAV